MAEYWEPIYLRGQQTALVWVTHGPTLAMGTLSVRDHSADVSLLLMHATECEEHQQLVNETELVLSTNLKFIRELCGKLPKALARAAAKNPEQSKQLKAITKSNPRTQAAEVALARRLAALWKRVNTNFAAEGRPVFKLGSTTVGQLDTAIGNHTVIARLLRNKQAELIQKESLLRTTSKRVAVNNRRWHKTWAEHFEPGSPEHQALNKVFTGESAGAPEPLEIRSLTRSGAAVYVHYVEGGGRGATSLKVLHKVEGEDKDFAWPETVILAGQTVGPLTPGSKVHFKTRISNSHGSTESAAKSITLS
jgi:hypothetical protein